MDRRFLRRRVANDSARRRLVLWAAVLSTLVVALVVMVGFAPVFVVEDVEVSGGSPSVIALAKSNAQAPIGDPLARVDTSAIAQRVLDDARIQAVEVGRGWPSSVTIDLTMRVPVAVLRQPNKPLWLVDASGIAFEEVAESPDDLPEVSAPSGEIDSRSIAGALEAVSSLGDPLSEDVSGVNVTADGDVRFTMGSIDILWGRPDQVENKAAAVQALLAQETIDPQGSRSLTIDVTAPATPVVTGLPRAQQE